MAVETLVSVEEYLNTSYSPDMEYLEITAPADFGTIDVAGPCPVPAPTAWAKAAE